MLSSRALQSGAICTAPSESRMNPVRRFAMLAFALGCGDPASPAHDAPRSSESVASAPEPEQPEPWSDAWILRAFFRSAKEGRRA